MGKRLEFDRKTRAKAFERSGGFCQGCSRRLVYGDYQYDHIREANDKPDNSLENCQVLCTACHKIKTAKYVQETRKAERIRDKHIGAIVPKSAIQSPGFRPRPKQQRASRKLEKWAAWREI